MNRPNMREYDEFITIFDLKEMDEYIPIRQNYFYNLVISDPYGRQIDDFLVRIDESGILVAVDEESPISRDHRNIEKVEVV